jgi:hypothetical protein
LIPSTCFCCLETNFLACWSVNNPASNLPCKSFAPTSFALSFTSLIPPTTAFAFLNFPSASSTSRAASIPAPAIANISSALSNLPPLPASPNLTTGSGAGFAPSAANFSR